MALTLPFWLSLSEELLKRKFPTREVMRRNLYIHGMYIAPLALAFLVPTIALLYYVPTKDWVKAGLNISEIVLRSSQYMNYAVLIWFFIAEVRHFSREIKYPLWLAGILVALILIIPIRIFDFIQTARNLVTENPQVFWFGLYIIPITLVILGIILIKVLPNACRWIAQKISKEK